jgi:hypothetical protein
VVLVEQEESVMLGQEDLQELPVMLEILETLEQEEMVVVVELVEHQQLLVLEVLEEILVVNREVQDNSKMLRLVQQ